MSLPDGDADALYAACVDVVKDFTGVEPDASKQRDDWPSLPAEWAQPPDVVARNLAAVAPFLDLTELEGVVEGRRSDALLNAARDLCRQVDDATALNLMIAHPTIWAVALDKRHGSEKRAREFLWQESIKAARKSVGPPIAERFEDLGPSSRPALKLLAASMRSVAAFGDEAPPVREWIVYNYIPRREVTALSADGGTGKTQAAMQLQAAMALGLKWFNALETVCGRSLGIYLEDDADEVHRRFYATARRGFANVSELAAAHFLRREDAPDNTLMTFGRDGAGKRTRFFDELRALLLADRFDLVVIDPAANVFGGNENDRSQVTQFVTALRVLAHETGSAILLLVHPSRTGIAAGTGDGGSTAWNNAVRSRLFLNRVKVEGIEPNPNLRTLTRVKSNYAAAGEAIKLVWSDGVFDALPSAVALSGDAADELLFLELLDEFEKQNEHVSTSKHGNYAPKLFTKYCIDTKRLERPTQPAMDGAMRRLLQAGRIKSADYRSGHSTCLVRVPEGERE